MALGSRDLANSCDKIKPLYFHYQSAYGYQTWQDGKLPWWARVFKVTFPFAHVILWDHLINWNHYISTTTVPMATKLDRMVTYLNGLVPVKSHSHLITWFCKITWQTKIIKSSLPLSTASKLDRMITYLDELLPIKSHVPLITWSCEITWQNKTTIFSLSECLWLPNLAGW